MLLWEHPNQRMEFLCFTLEDEHRETKVMHHTRIPEGIYKLSSASMEASHQLLGEAMGRSGTRA